MTHLRLTRTVLGLVLSAIALSLGGPMADFDTALSAGTGGQIDISTVNQFNLVGDGSCTGAPGTNGMWDAGVTLETTPGDPFNGSQVSVVYDNNVNKLCGITDYTRNFYPGGAGCLTDLASNFGGLLASYWSAGVITCLSSSPNLAGAQGIMAVYHFQNIGICSDPPFAECAGSGGVTAVHLVEPAEVGSYASSYATFTINNYDSSIQADTYSCGVGPPAAAPLGCAVVNGSPFASLLEESAPSMGNLTVSGHVYLSTVGNGLNAVSVQVCDSGGAYCYPPALTAADGSYAITGVAPASYTLKATPAPPTLPGSLGPILVTSDVFGQDLILSVPTGAIRGHVYHDAATPGNELVNAGVMACSTTGGPCLPMELSASDGSYTLNNLPDGTYTLNVYPNAPYYQTSIVGVVVSGGGATSQNLVVTAQPTGSIGGHVYHDSSAPGNALSGVLVSACLLVNSAPTSCSTASTDANGAYTVGSLADGAYVVTASPQSPFATGNITATVSGGLTGGHDVIVVLPTPVPPQVSFNTGRSSNGVPLLYWGSPQATTATGCPSGSGTWELDAVSGSLSGIMTESPSGSGSYSGSVPAPHPLHGATTFTITIHCPNLSVETYPFTLYIDPSGYVRDTAGNVISGATVTLYQSDSPNGPFVQVSDGSLLMSPSNRHNPDATDAAGHFGWDVATGYYKVRASLLGCVAPGAPFQSYVESGVMAIPPPVTDLNLRLDCANTSGDGYPDSLKLALGKDPEAYCAIMRADINLDGTVNGLDLSQLAKYFTETVPPAPSRVDINHPTDNAINGLDLSVMAKWFTHAVSECP